MPTISLNGEKEVTNKLERITNRIWIMPFEKQRRRILVTLVVSLDKDGNVAERFSPTEKPDSLESSIKAQLNR